MHPNQRQRVRVRAAVNLCLFPERPHPHRTAGGAPPLTERCLPPLSFPSGPSAQRSRRGGGSSSSADPGGAGRPTQVYRCGGRCAVSGEDGASSPPPPGPPAPPGAAPTARRAQGRARAPHGGQAAAEG